MEFKSKLLDEINREFEKLEAMEVGTDEYKATVDGLTKLVDRAIEVRKVEISKDEKSESFKLDSELKRASMARELEESGTSNRLKEKQVIDEEKDRLIKNCIAVAGIVLPSIITVWGTLKSFQFEKEGTVTSIMGRGFINKLLPRK